MRVSDGACKINTQGGAIHIHADRIIISPGTIASSSPHVIDTPQSLLAPIEIRDFVYSKLLGLSPATRYRSALISGDNGLLARGLSEAHFANYGGLPANWRERDRIARRLSQEAVDHFRVANPLLGVPGFWMDEWGIHLWKQKDYLSPRLLISVLDECGRVQACQMRLPFATRSSMRYCWLSSSGLRHGTGSGSPLHYKFRVPDLPGDATIVIVEGVLKADVLFAIRPELHIIATPSVTANNDTIVNLCRGRRVLIAFDQDYYTNHKVCLHLAVLIARRMQAEGTLATTRIAAWDRAIKGIDDAVLRKLPINSISVQCWLNRLSPHFQREVMTVWQEDSQRK
ncbi:MAG: DUF3854 domain-containing protein [Acidobacteria bacterium]|nr:DUF3854 domain-containing protein [Acidobacteriota bacterium]